MFHLDHKSGNKDVYDITYSTLLSLVKTTKEKIDLVLGYFQLFPDMEAAITRAVTRGVQISLTTNSDHTNGMPYFNVIYRHALERLLELGVNVFVTVDSDKLLEGDSDANGFALHYKLAVFDQRVAFVDS